VPDTPPESSTTQVHRLSPLLSYRILYTAVSFGLTLGSDVSAKDIGVSRTSFRFNQHYNFNYVFIPSTITEEKKMSRGGWLSQEREKGAGRRGGGRRGAVYTRPGFTPTPSGQPRVYGAIIGNKPRGPGLDQHFRTDRIV
jgi:hypothetical protein